MFTRTIAIAALLCGDWLGTAHAESAEIDRGRDDALVRAPSLAVGRLADSGEIETLHRRERRADGVRMRAVPAVKLTFCSERHLDGEKLEGCVPVFVIGPRLGQRHDELREAVASGRRVMVGLQPFNRGGLNGYVIVHNWCEDVTSDKRLEARTKALVTARAQHRERRAQREAIAATIDAGEVTTRGAAAPRDEPHPGPAEAPADPAAQRSRKARDAVKPFEEGQ